MTLTTTLNRIKACNPCDEGWQAGLQAAGKTEPDDEPISYEAILDALGLEKALWCCQAEPQHASLWRKYAVHCARSVRYLMTDPRSIAALDVAERYANGEATDEELAAAKVAAMDAAWSVSKAASDAAYSAAYSAWAAAAAPTGYARAAARAAAAAAKAAAAYPAWSAAARAAAWSASAAAARAAADAASAAARDAQSAAFRQLITAGTLPPVQPITDAIQ